jgi:hypothetical protein
MRLGMWKPALSSTRGARRAEGVGEVILSDLAAEIDAGDAGEPVVQTAPDPRVDDLGPQLRSCGEVAGGVEIARSAGRVEAVDVDIDCVVPRTSLKTSASAEMIEPCAAGYSGWFGVVSKGRHPGCSAVAGLPSSNPGTGPKPSLVTEAGSMAVTGRQKR